MIGLGNSAKTRLSCRVGRTAVRRAAGGEKRAIERGARAAAGGGAARGEPTQTASGETVRVVLLRCEKKKNTFCALESYGDAVSQKNEDRLILLAPCEPTHTSKRTPRADHFARAR